MKRNFRIVLLLALVVLMLGVTMLVAAADPAPAPADTDYFEVLNATGEHVGYYGNNKTALSNVVKAVTADGFTIKLLKDVDVGEGTGKGNLINFNKDFACTIDGDGHTLTFKGMTTPLQTYGLAVTKGQVTLKNITLTTLPKEIKETIINPATQEEEEETTYEYLACMVYLNSTLTTCTVTFENTTLEGGATQIQYKKGGAMTFKGTGNVIGKNNAATAANAITLLSDSKDGQVIIEGGQFIARSLLFDASGASIEVRGGTFENASGSGFFALKNEDYVSAIKILDGTFTLNRGGIFFDYSGKGDCVGFAANDNALINISGGRFLHYGAGNLFSLTAQSITNHSADGGTMSAFGYAVVKINDGGTAEVTRLIQDDNNTPIEATVTVKLPLFDGWPDQGNWAPGAWTSDRVGMGIGTINADVFYINNCTVHLDIGGGTYIGSPYTNSLIETAPQNATNLAEVNITGGSFIGSRAWIRTYNASVWNVGGTSEFSDPAPKTFELDLGQYDQLQGKLTDVNPIMLQSYSGRTFKLDASAEGKEYRELDETVTNKNGEKIKKRVGISDGNVVSYSRDVAGQLNITGGTFNVATGNPCWIYASGADVYISGGTFNIGCRGIQMNDGDMISYVYISGGTFNAYGNFELIYYSGSNAHKYSYDYDTKTATLTKGTKYAQRGLLEITGGTFNTSGKCTAIRYDAAFKKRTTVGDLQDGYVHITGGTFHSDGIYLINLQSGMAGELLITGGTFEGTAPRLISMAGYKGPFTITGGTFRLSALGEGATPSPTDAIFYIKTTSSNPVLNIEGGTFINEREGADRLILFDSKTATLNLLGGKFMTRYATGSYLERYMNHNNMHVNPDLGTKETVDGVEYNVATVYAPSNANAPTMEADVTIRLNQDTPGIRFTSYMSQEKITALRDAGATALAYGTLIAPREYLMQITDFTDVHGQLKAIAAAAGVAESKVFADVAAGAGSETDIDGNVTFRAALVNISDVNRGYGAISYVKVTSADGDVYYYSGFNVGSNLATLKTVVLRELFDVNDKSEIVDYGKYVYKYGSINDDGFSRFTQAEQNFMRRLVAGK